MSEQLSPDEVIREVRFFEATDDLVRAVLAVVQFHYGHEGDTTDVDVAALHHRVTDAAMAYLDSPSIYPRAAP